MQTFVSGNDLIDWISNVVEKEGGKLSTEEAHTLAGEAMAKCEIIFSDIMLKAVEVGKKKFKERMKRMAIL